MEEKNYALSAELIGLRGGLSLISKYTDEIKRCQNDNQLANAETKKKEYDLQKVKEKCEMIDSDISLQEDHCENLRKEYAKIKVSSPDLIASIYDGSPEMPEYPGWSWFLAILSGVAFFVYFYIYDITLNQVGFFGNGDGAIPSLLTVTIIFVIPILRFTIVPIIMFFIRCGIHAKNMKSYKKSILQAKDTNLKDEEATLAEMKSVQETALVEKRNAERDLQKQIENEIQRNKENAEMISILAEKSHAVNESLRTAYNVMLLECDWNNVDLVLHYIETGRAESLKEALQQVDRQRQTDQITNAIKSASAAMSSHLESAFSRMGDALARCFGRLNANIQDATSQFERQIEISQRMANEANRQLLEQLDKQISATEMQNVLLEKANKSSDELLYDLRYNQQFWRK